MNNIVIVGAGQAGASLAAKLRARGFTGELLLVGGEPFPPYQRPPLSKGYLLGEMELDRLFLRPREFYAEQGIDLRCGAWVSSIDTRARTIKAGNEVISYGQLALTTGAVPRRLPDAVGGALKGVFTVRGLADVDAMKPEFASGRRVLIVGGGYIGLEAAAVAAKLGLAVTLVETAPRILQRVAAPETSAYFRALHRAHGVEVIEGGSLERLEGENRVQQAALTDGRTLEIDFAIVGVGVSPDSALAQAAGLDVENGIKTDEYGRTSNPAIWAAGDCASFPWKGGRIRLESVGHAIDHAELVAENMLGAEKPYVARPWFWSDQYDIKLQIAGLNTGYDSVAVRRGEGAAQSVWYFRGCDLLAVDAMNDPRAYMAGKRMIDAGLSVSPERVADMSVDVKVLLSEAGKQGTV